MLHLDVITLFPEIFTALSYGISGRAIQQNRVSINYWNPRDFTEDKHRVVDDRPYGGGPGMLMKVAPLQKAIHAAKKQHPLSQTIYLSPQGKPFTQAMANQFSQKSSLIFVAGRYEGIDERLLQTEIDEEWSIGDYVLSGGEIPILVVIDSLIRLLPGALGDETSALNDSFCHGLLDHPHYTRPEEINGCRVPEVLLNGNHALIEQWRLKQSLGQTWLKRPDLLAKKILSESEKNLLHQFISEYHTHQNSDPTKGKDA